MELKEFLSESLSQIIEGINDAQNKVGDSNAEISPEYSNRQIGLIEEKQILKSSNGGLIQNIDFDVAVTVTEGTDTKAGVGVVAGMFNLGASGASNQENQQISRIKFSVPVVLPTSAKKA